MRRVHKITSWVLTLLFALALVPAASASASAAPTQIINVVYDDSGSMIETDGQLVDTWCQAKYAMEVFAALLGTHDTMNVYVMSDFAGGGMSAAPKLVLKGGDGQAANVAKVHGMLTAAGGTPFNSVRKAYADLEAAAADEKWLVVLTDGSFQGVDNMDAFFAQKADDVNVMFLGMGPNASQITANPSANIYCEKAATSREILSSITGICTRIFNSDRLEVNVSAKTITFDVPMAELVVFAQGAHVSVNGIVNGSGKEFLSSTQPVSVQYSEQAASNHSEFVVARDLKGSVSTFKDDFEAGSYTLDIAGADTIEVYYKPNVEIAAYLTDSSGAEVTSMESLKAGEYTIEFGFVKAGTSERVNNSSLLGDVFYSAVVTNNGVTHEAPYSSGDTIYIEEGPLEIDATAHYLEYHSVSTHLDYSIYADKEVALSVIDTPTYAITRDGIDAADPIRVKALLDGREITAEQWAEMSPLSVCADSASQEGGYGPFTVEKSEVPGIYEIYPSLSDGDMNTQLYGGCTFLASYDGKHGQATWSGATKGTFEVNDTRTWLDRHMQEIIRWAVILAIALLILGYIPPFKKYLPKKLKKSPGINCSPTVPIVKPTTESGRLTKFRASTLIPYRAQRGTIRFVPSSSPVSGIPSLKVKAVGGNGMLILNTADYAGDERIKFDGQPVAAGVTKPMRKGAGTMITVKGQTMTYTCVPSKK